jgi:hypothetical protein
MIKINLNNILEKDLLCSIVTYITILNESTTFLNQIMCVSAYKQAIFKCYLTILQKGQVTEFYSVDPLSHDKII